MIKGGFLGTIEDAPMVWETLRFWGDLCHEGTETTDIFPLFHPRREKTVAIHFTEAYKAAPRLCQRHIKEKASSRGHNGRLLPAKICPEISSLRLRLTLLPQDPKGLRTELCWRAKKLLSRHCKLRKSSFRDATTSRHLPNQDCLRRSQ